ncbi:uncharacterized protein LOC134217023 [Armigeres subalbatus]|uniref:uncharacterized protein LOC134217023 n=1 Tax=Armigeres subalbatus TaxID=124917 RepID=UPI002ED33AC6
MLPTTILLGVVLIYRSVILVTSQDCIDRSLSARMEDCCLMPKPFPRNVLFACSRKIRQLSSASPAVLHWCKMECYYKELGILADDNILNMDRIRQFLEKMDERVQTTYETAYRTCEESLLKKKDNVLKAMCGSYPALMEDCVKKIVDERCKDDSVKDYFFESVLCNQVRAGQTLCPT